MIEVRIAAGGARYVRQTAPRPLVYLDHGPMGQIAEHDLHGERFIAVLQRRGTLALSLLNLLEITKQTEGLSVSLIERLLARVDRQFALITVHVNGAIARAATTGCSELEASLDDQLAGLFAASVAPTGGLLSAAPIARWLRGSAAAQTSFETMRRGVQDTMAKSGYRDLARGVPQPRTSFSADGCLTALMHHALVDSSEFTSNDSTDLLHLALPLAVCDFVVADKKWVPRAERLAAPPRRASVFSGKAGQIDAFLDALENFSDAT